MSAALRVVFFGSDTFSLPILEALLERGGELKPPIIVTAVVTQPDRPSGRGRKTVPGPVKLAGIAAGVPVQQSPRVRTPDAIAELRAVDADIFVVASFGQLLPQRVLDIPRLGCLNLHPSLLPRYRGPSPIVAPILAGDRITGTTLMRMALAMDAGPIVAQTETTIGTDETAGELEGRLAGLSADLLMQYLPDRAAGTAVVRPQDESLATYTSLLRKSDALIDWSESAVELGRAVQGYNPWPVAHTDWDGQLVRIFRATAEPGTGPAGHVLAVDQSGLLVATGDGALRVSEMQLAGGRRAEPVEVVRGRPALLNAVFGVTS